MDNHSLVLPCQSNKTKLINTLFFLCFILICVIFGKVRTLLYDGSTALFYIYELHKPYVVENRWPTAIYSILPLFAAKSGMSLKYIMYASMISYSLLPVLIFLFFRYLVKNEAIVSIFLVSLCFLYFNAFFVASQDTIKVHYFIFFLYYLLIVKFASFRVQYLLITVFIFLLIFGHIEQVISIVFVCGYLIITKQLRINPIFLCVVIMSVFAVKITLFTRGHEADIIQYGGGQLNYFRSLGNNEVAIGFLKSLRSYNLLYLIFFLLLNIFLISKRKYMLSAYYIFCSLASSLLVMIYLRNFEGFNWYTEPHFRVLSLLTAIIFVNHFECKRKWIKLSAYGSIYLYYILILIIMGKSYNEYYSYVSSVGKTLSLNTAFISEDPSTDNKYRSLYLECGTINLVENDNCHSFTVTTKNKFTMPEQPSSEFPTGKFCFEEPLEIKDAPDNMELILDQKYRYYLGRKTENKI